MRLCTILLSCKGDFLESINLLEIGAGSMLRKLLLSIIFLAVTLTVGVSLGFCSWLIDPARFHISAHGQLSCQECHDDVTDRERHPDPLLVKEPRSKFFSPEHCISCHDEVPEDLEKGLHGRKKVTDKEKYTYCIRCHRPHYQMRIGPNRIGHFQEGIPMQKQCSACHEAEEKLPPFPEEDKHCLTCHLQQDISVSEGREKVNGLCMYCHVQGEGDTSAITGQLIPLIDLIHYQKTPHSTLACIQCHSRAAAFDHDNQRSVDCLNCHIRHDEKVAHDAHLTVHCGACHLQGVKPFRDEVTGQISFEVKRDTGEVLKVHEVPRQSVPDSCKRCHFKGNDIGAASSVLPAKSVICMGCHAATFSVGDTTTIISLIIFLVGVLIALSYFLSGSIERKSSEANSLAKFFILIGLGLRGLFSRRFPLILKALILDVLLQRRLYKQSEARWWIHALIFYPFVFRFAWGMAGLLGSLWSPSSNWVWSMLDKNNIVVAFSFDLSGILLLLGVFLALCRETIARLQRKIALPRQDPWALLLMGGIVVAGFLAEGIRMAMTGLPGSSEYALVGYWISSLFFGIKDLGTLYVYAWYAHAVLVGAFVAYIPFSRLFHIIMGPVSLLINAGNNKRD